MTGTASSFHAQVREMRERQFPVSRIADVMRVHRKTTYAWLDGAEPAPDAVARLAIIYPLLEEAFGSNLRTAHRFWNTRDRSFVTFGDLLSAEVIDVPAIRGYLATFASAISRYARQDAAYWPSSGSDRNPLIDDCPIVDFGNC